MTNSIPNGVWPTMITPFTDSNRPDFRAISAMCDWYIARGCNGIFAVCQSSEMHYLSGREKEDIGRCVVESCAGRIPVVASGHTSPNVDEQKRGIETMMKTGADAYVLVSNTLDPQRLGEAALEENIQTIFRTFPEVPFGIYECPHPYKRLLSTDFIKRHAPGGQLVFVKDTCCDQERIRERLEASKGTPLKLFNANAATLYDSLVNGAAGYSGVMANYHPELYCWLISHLVSDPETAKLLADVLTVAAMIEMRIYPVSAKYHMNRIGLSMELITRSADARKLDQNARLETESLLELEHKLHAMLGLSFPNAV